MATKTQRDFVDGIGREFRRALDLVGSGMKELQEDPPGQRKRTPAERRKLFDRMVALGPAGFHDMMEEIAKRAGHEPDESAPCEGCKFFADNMLERVKRS